MIKFDGDVKEINHQRINSKELFELKCIDYLDNHNRAYEIDYFMYLEDGEVLYTYNNHEEKSKIR